MVEELLERFSAVVSDVCACLMGLSGPFLEGKFNLGLKQLRNGQKRLNLDHQSQPWYESCKQDIKACILRRILALEILSV